MQTTKTDQTERMHKLIWVFVACVFKKVRFVHALSHTYFVKMDPLETRNTPKHKNSRLDFIRLITNTYLYNFDPLKPHFYIVKLGFTGYTLFFLFLLQNIDCGYSLEPPRRGGSTEYPQSMFWAEIWKLLEFESENFQFLVVKFSIYLNRRVFIIVHV